MIDRLVCADGGNPDPTTNHRFVSPETAKITAEQIPQLKLKWAVAFPDAGSIAPELPAQPLRGVPRRSN
jgi:hypothetical protein